MALVRRTPRSPSIRELADILDEMELLRAEVINRLEIQENTENMSTNGALNEQHIQSSNPEPYIDLEPSAEEEQRAKPRRSHKKGEGLKAFPLGMVLKACPAIADYGPGGGIGNWRDLMAAAV